MDYEGASWPLCVTTDSEVAQQWLAQNKQTSRHESAECEELELNDFSGMIDNRTKFGKWLKEHLNVKESESRS
jgi:hypothetical protein